jgi:hypothetical protein
MRQVYSDLEMLSKVNSENYIMLEMLIGNHEEFSFINRSLQCCNESEDCEEAVVRRIATKHHKTSGQEPGKDDTTEHEGVRVQILVPIC